MDWSVTSAARSPVSLRRRKSLHISAAAEACPVFHAPAGQTPVKVHWGYPDPSNAPDADKPRAFELTRQAIGYRMLQLLALPATLADADLKRELERIGRS